MTHRNSDERREAFKENGLPGPRRDYDDDVAPRRRRSRRRDDDDDFERPSNKLLILSLVFGGVALVAVAVVVIILVLPSKDTPKSDTREQAQQGEKKDGQGEAKEPPPKLPLDGK